MVDAPLSAAELGSLQAAGLGGPGTRRLLWLKHAQNEISWGDDRIEKPTFEVAQLTRVKSGTKSEQLDTQRLRSMRKSRNDHRCRCSPAGR